MGSGTSGFSLSVCFKDSRVKVSFAGAFQHLRLFLDFCQGGFRCRVLILGWWDGGGPTSPNVKAKSQFAKPQHNFILRLAMGIFNNYAKA